MKPSVYLETSIISYLTARPSRDIVIAAHQTITEEWWHRHRDNYHLHTSLLVMKEISAGDPEAARRRLNLVRELPILEINTAAETLSDHLLATHLVPRTSAEDALHIAIATVHGMDYLLTWNFRHINNAVLKPRITTAIEALGFEAPILCSPEELGDIDP